MRLVAIVKFVFIKNCILVTKVKGDSLLTVIGDFPQYFKGSWLKTGLYKTRRTLRHIEHKGQERLEQISRNEEY